LNKIIFVIPAEPAEYTWSARPEPWW